MELSSTHPKIIGQLLEVLRENLSDVLFHFHPDSIKLRSADSAKTFIVYVNLVNFEKYECKKYLPVGINIGKLWTVVKLAHPEDILQMECKADGEHLQIYIKDSKTNQIRFETRYITYECDEDALEIPESINFETCISMNSNEFYSNLKNLENLEAEFVKLCQCTTPTGENRLRLIGIGSPSHKEPKFDIDEVAKPSTANSIKRGKLPELSFVFPLKKLVQFAKAHCLDPDVRIHLSEKGYLVLQYSIKVYGDLRFVHMATDEGNSEDGVEDADDDSDAVDEKAELPVEEVEEVEEITIKNPVPVKTIKRARPLEKTTQNEKVVVKPNPKRVCTDEEKDDE